MARDKRLLVDLLRYFGGDGGVRFDAWDASSIRRHIELLTDDDRLARDGNERVRRILRPLESRFPEPQPVTLTDDGSVLVGGMPAPKIEIGGCGPVLGPLKGEYWYRVTSAGYDWLDSLDRQPERREAVIDSRRQTLLMEFRDLQLAVMERLWLPDGTTPTLNYNSLSSCWSPKIPSNDDIRKCLSRIDGKLASPACQSVAAFSLDCNGSASVRLVLPG